MTKKEKAFNTKRISFITALQSLKEDMQNLEDDQSFKRRICAFEANCDDNSRTHGSKEHPFRALAKRTTKPTFVPMGLKEECGNEVEGVIGIQIGDIALGFLPTPEYGDRQLYLGFIWGGLDYKVDTKVSYNIGEIYYEIDYLIKELENADKTYSFKAVSNYLRHLNHSFEFFKSQFEKFDVDCCEFCDKRKSCRGC